MANKNHKVENKAENEDKEAGEEQAVAASHEEQSSNGNGVGEATVSEADETVAAEVTESVEVETPEETIARLEAELAEAQANAAAYLDQMQRTAAEFQNTRRRQERQLQASIERATEGLILRLLPVLDDLELAFQNVPESVNAEEAAWVDGFRQIRNKLLNILKQEGVEPIAPEGEFDPNHHEAITNEPSNEVESGHIIATLRTGYKHKDRVLRPALVRVAQ